MSAAIIKDQKVLWANVPQAQETARKDIVNNVIDQDLTAKTILKEP